jgi:hypothetical protein
VTAKRSFVIRHSSLAIGHWSLIILFLLAFFAQAITSLPLKAPTFDEEFHIARAYAYLGRGDLRMQQNHPPLVSVLSGLPLLLMPELTPPEEIPHWDDAFLFDFADSLFWRLGHDVDKMLFLARFPIVLLGVLLGVFIYRWAREAYGARAGLLAAGLYAFAPNLLAHTRLVTTDLAVTACGFIALYAFWRTLRQPTAWRAALAGLALGLALAAKLSALLLIPVMGVLTLLELTNGATRKRQLTSRSVDHWSLVIGHSSLVILLSALVIWAFYRFEVRPWPGTRVLLPATTYLLNVRTLIGHAGRGHGAFLMGQVSMHGWWTYFPVAFVLKTPLLTLGLLGVSVWDTVRTICSVRSSNLLTADFGRWWREDAALLLYPAAYFGLAMASSLNIGFRYILPIVPFLIVYAAKPAGLAWIRPAWLRQRALPALLILYAGVALWLHPHYLAYFNLLAGGPQGGYRYLVDSNLDWGQDLKLLKAYLGDLGIDETDGIWLGYFGTADPAYYGIRYRSLFKSGSSDIVRDFAPMNPAPGWYAISATVLQGPFSPEPDVFDWFRRHEPVAKIGYSIFVYQVAPDPDPPAWLGLCYTPEQVMRDSKLLRRLGRSQDDLRLVGFDCGQTWVYPAGGGPGWYLVPAVNGSGEQIERTGSMAEEWLGKAEVVYQERGLRDEPAYTLYRWDGAVPLDRAAVSDEAWSSPVLAPGERDPVTPVAVPADLGGQASFLGYRLPLDQTVPAAPGGVIALTTAWQVIEQPESPPLSAFAHVVGEGGALSVGDGLGFPAIQWLPGDVFLQRSLLAIPVDALPGRYWVQTGLYSLATGERLPVMQAGEPIADRLLLMPVVVDGSR